MFTETDCWKNMLGVSSKLSILHHATCLIFLAVFRHWQRIKKDESNGKEKSRSLLISLNLHYISTPEDFKAKNNR